MGEGGNYQVSSIQRLLLEPNDGAGQQRKLRSRRGSFRRLVAVQAGHVLAQSLLCLGFVIESSVCRAAGRRAGDGCGRGQFRGGN